MTPLITPYRDESFDKMNDLILRSKASWGYSPELLSLWRSELEVTAATLNARQFFLGHDGDRLVLIYSISAQSDSSCELEDCWVHPDLKGTGLGKVIFDDIKSRMIEHGWTSMRIVADPNAAGFYTHMGARQIGELASQPEGRFLPVFEWRPHH